MRITAFNTSELIRENQQEVKLPTGGKIATPPRLGLKRPEVANFVGIIKIVIMLVKMRNESSMSPKV